MPTTNNLLTTAEVAKRHGRDVRTVHRMVASGRLVPEMKLPGRTGALLFRADQVDAAFAATEQAAS